MEFEVVRSKRKTAGIQVKAGGKVILRIPDWYTDEMANELLKNHWSWIERKVAEQKRIQGEQKKRQLSVEEREAGISKAMKVFPERVSYYAEQMGVNYGNITIREQKTRWGSCSSKGNLNFNWKLVLTPDYVLDYVVIHELAHRKFMNHSSAFYDVVAQIMPDYECARRWLRENGGSIIE